MKGFNLKLCFGVSNVYISARRKRPISSDNLVMGLIDHTCHRSASCTDLSRNHMFLKDNQYSVSEFILTPQGSLI